MLIKIHSILANEVREWLLHYSLPFLESSLPGLYLVHYMSLVCGISFLVSDEVTEDDVITAEVMLRNICYLYEKIYGKHITLMTREIVKLVCCYYDIIMLLVICSKYHITLNVSLWTSQATMNMNRNDRKVNYMVLKWDEI